MSTKPSSSSSVKSCLSSGVKPAVFVFVLGFFKSARRIHTCLYTKGTQTQIVCSETKCKIKRAYRKRYNVSGFKRHLSSFTHRCSLSSQQSASRRGSQEYRAGSVCMCVGGGCVRVCVWGGGLCENVCVWGGGLCESVCVWVWVSVCVVRGDCVRVFGEGGECVGGGGLCESVCVCGG